MYYCNGTVVGVKATDMDFYVAMMDLAKVGMSFYEATSLCSNYIFCDNIKGSFPTKDQLLTLYRNQVRVNTLLSANEGTQLTNDWYWSSTHANYDLYYVVDMSRGYVKAINYGYRHYVRPVLTSW